MNKESIAVESQYLSALSDYMAQGSEASLSEGYALARQALAEGWGVLDFAEFHRKALDRILADDQQAKSVAGRAGAFFAECLSPFELSHRGAIEGTQALRRVNETLEGELQRVAHALHDEAGQLLASVYLAVSDVARDLPDAQKSRLETVENLLHQIEVDLRNLAHELRPSLLDDLGLRPAIEALADRIRSRNGIAVSVEGWQGGRVAPAVETLLFRIVQESLNNVIKHARARRVQIRLARSAGHISCTVRDDGIGFPVRPLGEPRGLGIRGMRERVQALGGTLHIQSEPMQGAAIVASLPLHERDHEKPHSDS